MLGHVSVSQEIPRYVNDITVVAQCDESTNVIGGNVILIDSFSKGFSSMGTMMI